MLEQFLHEQLEIAFEWAFPNLKYPVALRKT